MIISFKHKGLENFFTKNQTKGVIASHTKKLKQILAILNAAKNIDDIKSVKSLRCHKLAGNKKTEHSVWVNKNWRVTFRFENGDAYILNYEDYH